MTDKEAVVYVVDVGASMGGRKHGRQQSDLDWAMTYAWDKITAAVCGASEVEGAFKYLKLNYTGRYGS